MAEGQKSNANQKRTHAFCLQTNSCYAQRRIL